ncbi:hypothetical protein P3X46_031228 [Hevea brasiliensis]|uniref:BZIP domain-containing protein n=1 Tax=Hevea brasiliensis TaxID=3981 RepID=A0ABQ9KLH6_HEVBR|nr:hypothetical protein P3X46_031228 [Hevea brasiliensis]
MAMKPQEIKGLQCLPHANSLQNLPTLSPSVANLNFEFQPIKSTGYPYSHANLSKNPESNSSFFNGSFSSISHSIYHLQTPHDHQLGISHERRLKRMISNRESARRSRLRKKKQIEEFQCQLNHLQTTNHQLSEKVTRLSENNHQILQENSQLKEKVSSFQVVLSDLLTPIRNVEESIYDAKCLRGGNSN